MTGIGAMLFYSTNFFEMAGIDSESCQFATIGVGGIIFVMTLATVPLMDKLGRRTLFLTGSIGQIICHIVLTIALVLHNKDTEGNLEIFTNVNFILGKKLFANFNKVYWGWILPTMLFDISILV